MLLDEEDGLDYMIGAKKSKGVRRDAVNVAKDAMRALGPVIEKKPSQGSSCSFALFALFALLLLLFI